MKQRNNFEITELLLNTHQSNSEKHTFSDIFVSEVGAMYMSDPEKRDAIKQTFSDNKYSPMLKDADKYLDAYRNNGALSELEYALESKHNIIPTTALERGVDLNRNEDLSDDQKLSNEILKAFKETGGERNALGGAIDDLRGIANDCDVHLDFAGDDRMLTKPHINVPEAEKPGQVIVSPSR